MPQETKTGSNETRRQIILSFVLVLLLALLDQWTKQLALEMLFEPPRVIIISGFFNLVPVWNPGISFGLFGESGRFGAILLTGIAFAAAIGLPLVARHWPGVPRLGAVMMAGGALGNAIDRVIHGKVVDFIDLHWQDWHWPAFNLADSAITIGAGMVIIANLFASGNNERLE